MFGLESLPRIEMVVDNIDAQLAKGLNSLASIVKGNTQAINGLDRKLDLILRHLNLIQRGDALMTQELQSLTDEVSRNTAVDQSAIELLNGLAAKIESLKDDPAALQALANDMKASSDALAAAVVANTPAAPTT